MKILKFCLSLVSVDNGITITSYSAVILTSLHEQDRSIVSITIWGALCVKSVLKRNHTNIFHGL